MALCFSSLLSCCGFRKRQRQFHAFAAESDGSKSAAIFSVAKTFKVVSLTIGLTAFAVLAIFGFAIWVFIPLLPAALAFLIALAAGKRRVLRPESEDKADRDSRKAA